MSANINKVQHVITLKYVIKWEKNIYIKLKLDIVVYIYLSRSVVQMKERQLTALQLQTMLMVFQ